MTDACAPPTDPAPPLAGVVVADFTTVLAGPLATMALADLGATVVKVERPDSGDETRSWGPPWTASASTFFESANRGKLSVALDLRSPGDRRLARELVARADVVVENFRTGVLARHGLGPRDAAELNPRLVYASITGFGSGAGAELPGYDFILQAVGGLMSVTGEPGGEPQKTGAALVDVLAAKDATVGILAALAGARQTGLGCHVEVDLLTSLLGALGDQAAGYLATGRAPVRVGNRHPAIAPYELLECRTGYLALACGHDAQFRRLTRALGLPHLADDPLYATNADRVRHRDDLAADLQARLLDEDAAHWEEVLRTAGVAAGQVGDVAAAFARADGLGLEPTVSVGPGHPPQVRHPVTFDGRRARPASPPPRLGEHDQVVRRWLERGEPGTLPGR